MKSIADRIKGLLADLLQVEPEKLKDDATLDGLGMDQLDIVELMLHIEDEDGLGIKLPGEYISAEESHDGYEHFYWESPEWSGQIEYVPISVIVNFLAEKLGTR